MHCFVFTAPSLKTGTYNSKMKTNIYIIIKLDDIHMYSIFDMQYNKFTQSII